MDECKPLVIGTSLSVYPAAELPQLVRLHTPGAPLVEINAVHAWTAAGAGAYTRPLLSST